MSILIDLLTAFWQALVRVVREAFQAALFASTAAMRAFSRFSIAACIQAKSVAVACLPTRASVLTSVLKSLIRDLSSTLALECAKAGAAMDKAMTAAVAEVSNFLIQNERGSQIPH